MSSATGCPNLSTLPPFDNIPGLPRNVSIGFVPVGRNGSREAMVTCCTPRAVGSDDCYDWYKLAEPDGFASCLVRHGMEKGIVGLHTSSAPGSIHGPAMRWGLARLAVCALLVAGFMHF